MTAATTVSVAQMRSTEPANGVLQLEVVVLPAYLDNTDILLRRGPHRLESAPLGHWGERLSLGITHALAADLTEQLPLYRVVTERPEPLSARRLRVNVVSFDLFPDGHCVLVADWAIDEKSQASAPMLGRGVFVTPRLAASSPKVAALVGAMNAAVAQLADGVVRSL
jgi:uncharacterized lipoprotein YmbA